uniref:Glycine receptor subunit alpha-2 n=1 Tax=Cryptocotyle lingua TaxID=66766 RepID=A0A7U0TIC9_9TREM|nr:glycine receptor subunit alpha-2 [Cryptocotyle lingua]
MAVGCLQTWYLVLFVCSPVSFHSVVYALTLQPFNPPEPYTMPVNRSNRERNSLAPVVPMDYWLQRYLKYPVPSGQAPSSTKTHIAPTNTAVVLEGTNVPKDKLFKPSITEEIMKAVLPSYRSHERPGEQSQNPTNVHVFIHILAVTSINVVQMEYTVDLYLRQRWVDTRLAWNTHSHLKHHQDSVLLTAQLHRLWIPDLFFRNGKRGFTHDMSVPNFLVRVSPDGSVLYSQKITMILSCSMFLKNYPMDHQECHMNLGSYGYTLDELKFVWQEEEAVTVAENLQLLEFESPRGAATQDCTKNGTTSTGTYSCLLLTISFQRLVASYLVTTYIPEVLIVMVSWLGFWIDVKAAPARISLGLLTLLALLTEGSGVSSKLPRVTYVKAIDVWINSCLMFVIAALLEFAVAYLVAPSDPPFDCENQVRDVIREVLGETLKETRCCCCYTKCTSHKPIKRVLFSKSGTNVPSPIRCNLSSTGVKRSTDQMTVCCGSAVNQPQPSSFNKYSSNNKCPLCQALQSNCCQCPLCVQLKCPKAPTTKVEKVDCDELDRKSVQGETRRSRERKRIVIREPSSSDVYVTSEPERQRSIGIAPPVYVEDPPRKSALKVRHTTAKEPPQIEAPPESSDNVKQSFSFCRSLLRILQWTGLRTQKRVYTPSKTPVPGAVQNDQAELYDSEIDAYSRFLFPACFLLFNCCYWFFYLIINRDA